MRKLLHFFLLCAIVWIEISCSKSNHPFVPSPEKPVIIKEVSRIPFRVIPLSATEVKLIFSYPPGRDLLKLFLKKDTTTLNTYDIINNTNNVNYNNYYTVNISYHFDSTAQYDFMLLTNKVKDTIYQYTLAKYIHNFKDAYTYRKVMPTTQSVAFDIAPSRNCMFVVDDSANILLTKKLSLVNYVVDTINTQAIPVHLRATSDSSFLIQTSLFNDHLLGGDSVALQEYNFVTHKATFLDWISNGYGRISRVVNNHVLATNPGYINDNTSLINLADKSKISYGPSEVDFAKIKEDNYDNIYVGNQVVNTQTGALTAPVPVSGTEAVEYIDNTSQLAIAAGYTQYLNDNRPNYSSHLSVYSNQNKIYLGEELLGRTFRFPAIQIIKNNTILFYQYFDYGTEFNVDGYYTLDLNTNRVTLIQCDHDFPYGDFQLTEKRMISIRVDGVYELVKK